MKHMTTAVLVDWFNETHPVGTKVTAFPGTKDGRAVEGQTRSQAWALPGGDPVVCVTGLAGGIHLSHIVCASHATHATGASA